MTYYLHREIHRFLTESLGIEGIHREPTEEEMAATKHFLDQEVCSVAEVLKLQKVYAPSRPLRDKPGMDVRVGSHIPLSGTKDMPALLKQVIKIDEPYKGHLAFETLHPFMDGNGRTGRTIWAWKMMEARQDPFSLPFLHRWYYQSLDHADGRK